MVGDMNLVDLRRLVKKGEGPRLEFKRSTGELKEGMKSLCGMFNAHKRGRVIFGVSDKGELLGQTVSEKTLREIANVSRSLEPFVKTKTTSLSVGPGLNVIVLEGETQSQGPLTFDGRGYLRVGNTTQQMARSEFYRQVVEHLEEHTPWDRWVAQGWTVQDLDKSEIRAMIEDAVATKRLTATSREKSEVILRRLELVTDQGVTRAAAILFGKGSGPRYPMGEIRLARFRGTTKEAFLDNRQFDGNAFVLLRHAEHFLDTHIPIASKFIPGQMRRKDIPWYPPLAVREALVNALVHRDYSEDGGAVSVALFDDRLEIWSAGTLPKGVTLKMLKQAHRSIPRNRLIASIFHQRGLIERWGRGTNEILRMAKEADCPEPEFEEISGAFVVRFRPVREYEKILATQLDKTATVEAGLGIRSVRLVNIIRRFGPMGAPAIMKKLGEAITIRSLQTDLQRLREAGQIISIGKGRAINYQTTKRVR